MDHDIVNFCYNEFLTNCQINCISADSRRIENLFSSDVNERKKGFQVERFIRPPVCVQLSFKVPIDVTHVVIEPCLDQDQSCKIDLSIERGNRKKFESYTVTSSGLPLVLCNRHWIMKHSNHLEMPCKVLGSLTHANLLSQIINPQLLKVKCTSDEITVKVSYWSGSKAIALKHLEVWGTIGRGASKAQRDVFKEIVKRMKDHEIMLATSKGTLRQKMYNCGDEEQREGDDEANINGDKSKEAISRHEMIDSLDSECCKFMDSLTCNLMTLPVLLPSGHYVDQSTVDKMKELDIMYGRLPSDPFTGIPYTTPPSFCPGMKAEIDLFLSNHHESLDITEQTVGSSQHILQHQHHRHKGISENRTKCRNLEQEYLQEEEEKFPSKKRKQIESSSHDEASPCLSERMTDHESKIKNSLEEALKSLYPNQ